MGDSPNTKEPIKWDEVSNRVLETQHVNIPQARLRAAVEWDTNVLLQQEKKAQAFIDKMSDDQRAKLKPEQIPDPLATENPAAFINQKEHLFTMGGKNEIGVDRDAVLVKIDRAYTAHLGSLKGAAQQAAPGLQKPGNAQAPDNPNAPHKKIPGGIAPRHQ